MRTLVWSAGGAAAVAGLACLAAGWAVSARAADALRRPAEAVGTACKVTRAVAHWQLGEAARFAPAGIITVTAFKPSDDGQMPYLSDGDEPEFDTPCPATMPYCADGHEPLPAPRVVGEGEDVTVAVPESSTGTTLSCDCCSCRRKCCGRGTPTWWQSVKGAVAGWFADGGGCEACEMPRSVIPVPGTAKPCPAEVPEASGEEESEPPVLRKKTTPANLPPAAEGKSKVDTMECRPSDFKMMPKANPDF